MTPLERLDEALQSATPAQTLRSAVTALVAEGQTRAGVYELLERLLLDLRTRSDRAEADEDVVLDLMDAISGWCHPSTQLFFGADTSAE